jgi:hypothetical protein
VTTHTIPARTVRLGTVLELVTRDRRGVTTWDEVKGWHLLTTDDAFERAPGRARLFLVPGTLAPTPRAPRRAGNRAYRAWHEREADKVDELEVPDAIAVRMGRALRLDYASDKWRGRGDPVEYTHDFCEGDGRPPIAYATSRANPRAFVLTGGSMLVSRAGIA